MTSPIATPEALLGRTIGGYRLASILGIGSASVVFLGTREDQPGAEVAIKVCLPPMQFTQADRQILFARYAREATVASRLQHPHIMPLLGHGVEDGFAYLILPYMRGGTLAQRIAQRSQPFAFAEIVQVVQQIAQAIDAAHAAGVIHRDIKPSNILFAQERPVPDQGNVGDYDAAALGDFGIVRLDDSSQATLTVSGQVVGTPEYMAPEQANGAVATPSVDIYGLGVVAYMLITRRQPFMAQTQAQVLYQVIHEPPPPPRRFRPDLPESAEAVIMQAVAKVPEHRFPTAQAFADALALGLQGQWRPASDSVQASSPAGAGVEVVAQYDYSTLPNEQQRQFAPRPSHTPRSVWVIAAVALAIVLLIPVLFFGLMPAKAGHHTSLLTGATSPHHIATATHVSSLSSSGSPPPSPGTPPNATATTVATGGTPSPVSETTTPAPTPTSRPPTPLDVNLLINPCFESSAGWQLSAKSYNQAGGYNCPNANAHYSAASYTAYTRQTVTQLTPGLYQASAWVQTSLNGSNTFALVDPTNENTLASRSISDNISHWTQITIQAQVTNGQAEVVFNSNNNARDWLTITDVSFMRLS